MIVDKSFNELPVSSCDRQLLRILGNCVPLLSLAQIADEFHQGDKANARRQMKRLASRGLVGEMTVVARTPPGITHMLTSWRPGESPPNFSWLSRLLSARWLRRGAVERRCYYAGPRLNNLLGLTLPLLRFIQASHELGLAELHLHYRDALKQMNYEWIGEFAFSTSGLPAIEQLFQPGAQRPDALILNSNGEVLRAVEYGGVYNAKRLERFHRWCQRMELPYEIW
jgi:hypothetical protein